MYRALSVEDKEIRVLQLLSGRPSSPIQCRLRSVSLAANPPLVYEALSYTWGRATQGRVIGVISNDAMNTVSVTDNLFAALKGLRHRYGRARQLWVDAVCINQSDLSERASQVSIMGMVYSVAEQVNVWLGDSTSSGRHWAIRFLCEKHRWSFLFQLGRFNPRQHPSWRLWLSESVELLRTAHWILSRTPEAIEEALENSEPMWSSRLWVVQECVLSRKLRLCCGRTSTPYKGLQLEKRSLTWQLYMAMATLDEFEVDEAGPTRPLDSLDHILLQYTNHAPDSLLEATRLTKDTAATDLRDRVYAVLGIVPEHATGGLDLRPNYTLEPWQVYARATFASTIAAPSHTGCLSTLALASLDFGIDLSLPAWAFDFRNVGALSPPGLGLAWFLHNSIRPHSDRHSQLARYWSGYGAPNSSLVSVSDDLRYLYVSGVIFAEVIACYSQLRSAWQWDAEADSDVGSIESSTILQDGPGCLYSDPTISRLRALYRAAKHQLANDEEDGDCQRDTETTQGAERIALWAGDCAVWEEPDFIDTEEDGGTPTAEEIIATVFDNWAYNIVLRSPKNGKWVSAERQMFNATERIRTFYQYTGQRVPQNVLDCFATSNGFLGLAVSSVEEGDVIALIKGCRYPAVVRRAAGFWKFMGICTLSSIMEGDLLQMWDDLQIREETFLLA